MVGRQASIAGSLLLGASLGFAQAPAEERIPITDPDQLAAVGMPRDATNVYLWSKADPHRGRPKSGAAAQAPETWGTAAGYSTVMGFELQQEHSSLLVKESERTYCHLYGGGGSAAAEGVAQLQFPDGAGLAQLQFWAYDENPTYGLTFNVYEFCQGTGFNPPTTTLIASADTFGAIGSYYGFTPLNGYKVNNRDCAYSVRVIFIPGGVECLSDQLQLQKFQVSWVRQVSPSPATASFGDVPTGHAFFRFIEALAKSGITGGCGGGNFCPEQPLTRGQMAVFLAKGLGLAWP